MVGQMGNAAEIFADDHPIEKKGFEMLVNQAQSLKFSVFPPGGATPELETQPQELYLKTFRWFQPAPGSPWRRPGLTQGGFRLGMGVLLKQAGAGQVCPFFTLRWRGRWVSGISHVILMFLTDYNGERD